MYCYQETIDVGYSVANAAMWDIPHSAGGSQQSSMKGTAFRPDIEGLRAISVLAVVFYHARIPGFSGGFVGVDVFFVISGFLITQLLLREIESSQRINVVAFWARRARRLLPNALLMIAVILFIAVYLLPVTQRMSNVRDIAAALMYIANYHFAGRTVDYFDHDLQFSPVLHFWSLSVEEQFYIGWPLLLMGLAWLHSGHSSRQAIAALCLILCGSFALSLLWMSRSQPQAFFSTEARIWQIATGGLLAAASAHLTRLNVHLLSSVAWLGFVGVLASVILFNDRLAYPGYWALLPTLSAAAVIAGGSFGGVVPTTILGLGPLQWVGRRSYSIYLWHWPLLMLVPLALPGLPHVDLIALALVVPIATAAFAIVEDPIRRRSSQVMNSGRTLAFATAGCVLLGSAGVAVSNLDWMFSPRRAEIARRLTEAKLDGPRMVGGRCDQSGVGDDQSPCVFGTPGSPRVVVLFGDSYAEHLFDGVNEAARLSKWELRVWIRHSCPPIDLPMYDTKRRAVDNACAGWREMVIRRLIAERPSLVLISSWAGLAGKMTDANTGKRLDRNGSVALWRQGFSTVLHRLSQAGLEVTVVRETPRNLRKYGSDCLERSLEHECATPRPQAIDVEMPDIETARGVPNIGVLDLTDHFCSLNACPAVKDGIIIYRGDNNHLTASFSLTLALAFQKVLAGQEERINGLAGRRL